MNNALSWLNRFEATHLRRTTQALLRHINDPAMDETKRQQMIESVIEKSHENADQFEYPELMLHLAGFYFTHDDLSTAMDFAQQARDALVKGSHTHAVACWIMGIIAWKTGENLVAFSSWYDARETFEKLAVEQEEAEKNVNAQWYRDLLVRLNMDLICKAEEVYTWLDLFEPSRLSAKVLKFVNEINNQINQDFLTESDKQGIRARVNDLHNLGLNSVDPLESAEVMLECAMLVFRLGDATQAQDLLQKTIEIFPPLSHQRAVVLWLLGIFEWQVPATRGRAISHWEESLDMIGSLLQNNRSVNNQQRANWYRQKQEIMSRWLVKITASAGRG